MHSAVRSPGTFRFDAASPQDPPDLLATVAGDLSNLADAHTTSVRHHDGCRKSLANFRHVGSGRSDLREAVLHSRKRGSVRLRRRLKVARHVATLAQFPRRPRALPPHGTVQIWTDAGSGGTGQRADVAVDRLRLAEIDSGEGTTALYRLETSYR
ncbi:hypothetical protein [Micromonospora sp. LOL_023]|uniref:hypothetical protein n=1 Tax=Micromonospora sp. LOL_023 TaxID=3345418 RepID=UPI003A8B01F8